VLRALHAHALDLALQAGDLVADEAAVGLELRLAGAAGADPPFEALEVGPLAAQSRENVLVLRQLNLETAFLRAGVLREDVEDQRRAIKHLHVERLLEVALLRRRQLIVEDDGGVIEPSPLRDDLRDLAFAYVGGGVAAVQPLRRLADDARSGGVRQQRQFVERTFCVPAPAYAVGAVPVRTPVLQLRRDEEGAFLGFGGLV
jgi:hypothetical protein